MVPEDIAVKKSLNLKDAVIHTHPKSNAARAYKEIAAKLLNVEYDSDKDREKLIKRILQRLGLKS
jgi:MinD-like ATPase involved in chromosome partitioning or flagellar assembly